MVDELSPEEVHERLGENGVQIVDIRQRDAYAHGHIPGSINVPLTHLARRIDEVDWGNEIVVACPIGQSSIQAARLIQSYEGVDEDATVASMKGGYDEWKFELGTGDCRSDDELR